MQQNTNEGCIKKETLYLAIAISLLVGFLSGVVFTIYKSPGGKGNSNQQVNRQSQESQGAGHDIAAIEQQAAETPDDPNVWSHLGDAYFDANMPAKAIDAYNKSLAIVPGNPNVLTDLGVMYRRNGQPDMALASFDKVIAMAPDHGQARFNKGVVLMFDKNDPAAGFKAWEELLAMNPMATAPDGRPLEDFIQEMRQRGNQ